MESLLSLDELKYLAQQSLEHCVSIYVPTHRTDPGQEQDPIRFRNLIGEAEESLIAKGLRAEVARQMLQPIRELDQYDFWQHQGNGLAIFCTQEWFRCYRLSLEMAALVVVGDRFYLKPLLPLFHQTGQFYILALSQNQVRLLQAAPDKVSEIDLKNKLPSLAEFLRFEQPERESYIGSPGTAKAHRGMGGATVFHGHGAGDVDKKENLRLYFCQVDRKLREAIPPDHLPLVVAGVEYLLSIYRQANTYPHLLEAEIIGNPELVSDQELYQQGQTMTKPYFLQQQQAAIAHYQELAGRGLTSSSLTEVIPAAASGRVADLFVRIGEPCWGRLADTLVVDVHSQPEPGDQELLDFAVVQTILHDGTVYALEAETMPDQTALAAVFRY
jgi:Bacterial archaeo-eukaryotic release factor family 3